MGGTDVHASTHEDVELKAGTRPYLNDLEAGRATLGQHNSPGTGELRDITKALEQIASRDPTNPKVQHCHVLPSASLRQTGICLLLELVRSGPATAERLNDPALRAKPWHSPVGQVGTAAT